MAAVMLDGYAQDWYRSVSPEFAPNPPSAVAGDTNVVYDYFAGGTVGASVYNATYTMVYLEHYTWERTIRYKSNGTTDVTGRGKYYYYVYYPRSYTTCVAEGTPGSSSQTLGPNDEVNLLSHSKYSE